MPLREEVIAPMWRYIRTALFGEVLSMLDQIRRLTMSNQERINRIADQLDKAHGEIVGGIEDLKAQVERGEELDFSRLEAGAQALDDLHADAEPEPEPPDDPAEPGPAPAPEPTDPGGVEDDTDPAA
ncbi:hypothetical protein IM25_21250 [Rhodococcus sp. p52]|nr:hypothetical protein IM25_21250 [Rhodococcus sp. p52]